MMRSIDAIVTDLDRKARHMTTRPNGYADVCPKLHKELQDARKQAGIAEA